ncbi:hypothetical protein A3K78_08845 [Candidatus Bathyarchaeota archaeon RBG_13_52_12]|jgi:hypothetical protein|nr:MAG: hypothetical protein A3K78_08845 [Candidatus Bathyarchaeota archaeon RBG_13_52_12]
MGFIDKLQDIDRRWVYLLTWIFVLFPLIFPLGLPVPIQKESTAWFNYIKAIPDGSVIVFAPMYGTSGMPELFPMTLATMHQLWSKNVKIIVVGFWAEGPLVFDQLLKQMDPSAAPYNKVYGTDWITLGYIPGGEPAMRALGDDIAKTAPKDYLNGKDTASYPIMANIKSAKDVNLIISIETGTPGMTEWLRQWNEPYKVPIVVGCIGVSAPGMAPFLQSGQLTALLPGLTSSAEYELLLNRKGLAIAGVDAVSMSHILVVLLVILGNVGHFATRRKS